MHWIEGSGKVLSAVATLNGVARKKKKKNAVFREWKMFLAFSKS